MSALELVTAEAEGLSDESDGQDRPDASSAGRVGRLTTDKIAATGLAIVDEQGVEGFTIRAVATALGVTPMALYNHVRDKAGLAALVVEYSTRQRPLMAARGVWDEDLLMMARWMREHVQAHPNIPRLRGEYKVWSSDTHLLTERWLSLWQQSGLDPKSAVIAAQISSMAVWGLVEQEAVFADIEPPPSDQLSWLPNSRLMYTPVAKPEVMFDIAVRSFIEGLRSHLMDKRAPAKALKRRWKK